VQARLSQCYDKVNVVVVYCEVEVYFHSFFAPALDANMSLNRTCFRQFPAERNTGLHRIRDKASQPRKDGLDKRNISCTIRGTEHILRDHRVVTLYTEICHFQSFRLF